MTRRSFDSVIEQVAGPLRIILNLSTDVSHDGFASLDVGTSEIEEASPGGTGNYGDGVPY